jgi:hypothetical protein
MTMAAILFEVCKFYSFAFAQHTRHAAAPFLCETAATVFTQVPEDGLENLEHGLSVFSPLCSDQLTIAYS